MPWPAKKQYNIDKVIVVADRGMMNTADLEAVKEKGYQFIVGEKLKMLSEPIKAKLIALKNYRFEWGSIMKTSWWFATSSLNRRIEPLSAPGFPIEPPKTNRKG